MTETMTLANFFFPERRKLTKKTRKRLESSDGMQKTSEALDQKAPEADWPWTFGLIAKRIPDALATDIAKDILVKVWNEGKLLDRYLNPDKYDPDETISVTLSEHSVTSKHRPSIEVTNNGLHVATVHFDMSVALDIEGAVLEIQGGRIKALRAGSVTARGKVSMEGLTLLEEKSKPFELPLTASFGEGIAIAPAG